MRGGGVANYVVGANPALPDTRAHSNLVDNRARARDEAREPALLFPDAAVSTDGKSFESEQACEEERRAVAKLRRPDPTNVGARTRP